MAEVYSSLYKGKVHITTPFSSTHPAIDMGNYKTRNPIYSPNKLGRGKVSKQTTQYTYNGVLYKNTLTQWIQYDSGFELCFVHGSTADRVLKVGDTVSVGQKIYVTGNTGYSKGDHLHCQLKKDGKLVDPSPYVLNDEITFQKIGDRFEFLGVMNIREKAGTSAKDIGDIAKGAVGEISSIDAFLDGYQWYGIRFGDKTGFIADTDLNQLTTRPMTNINGSKIEIPKDYKALYEATLKRIDDPETGYIKQLNDRDNTIKKQNEKLLTLNAQVAVYERFSAVLELLDKLFPSKAE